MQIVLHREAAESPASSFIKEQVVDVTNLSWLGSQLFI